MAKKANTSISIIQGTGYDGYYQNGMIYINVNSDNPIITTMKHEFRHYLEISNEYDTLMNMAMGDYGVFSVHGFQVTITNIINITVLI